MFRSWLRGGQWFGKVIYTIKKRCEKLKIRYKNLGKELY